MNSKTDRFPIFKENVHYIARAKTIVDKSFAVHAKLDFLGDEARLGNDNIMGATIGAC